MRRRAGVGRRPWAGVPASTGREMRGEMPEGEGDGERRRRPVAFTMGGARSRPLLDAARRRRAPGAVERVVKYEVPK